MERCVFLHRFVALVVLSVWLLSAAPGASGAARQPRANAFGAGASLVANAQPRGKLPQAQASQQPKNEEYTLKPDRYAKAVAFSRDSYLMYFISVFLAVVAILVLLQFGVVAKYRDWAERVSGKRPVQALVFVPLLLLTAAVVQLPLRLYGHRLSLGYEMSVQGWGSWFLDWGKERLLILGFGILLALGLSFLIRRSPRRWWLYGWFAALPVAALLMLVAPWFLDPLFSHFEPLKETHPELVARIEKLTQHAGVPIPASRMFLMKASEKTNEVNAYVTGVGASKRVVIWDTTIQKATPDETLYIVGHELGHYVLGHIWKGFLFFAVFSFVGFYALFRALHWALDRWGGQWKIYGAEDWAAFAVLLLLVEIGTFLASPIANGFSRMQEHAADVYGLEVAHGIIPDVPEVAAQSFQILGETDLADPNPPPFITLWLYSHPPISERLSFAYNYDPWDRGETPKYVK